MKKYIGVTKPLNIIATPSANLDAKYGAHDSIQDAIDAIPETLREIGLTVGIIINNKVVEYWWESGVSDSDLIVKTISSLSQLDNTDTNFIDEDSVNESINKETTRAIAAESKLNSDKLDASIFNSIYNNGVNKRNSVKTYNGTVDSLESVYGLEADVNGTNGKAKQNGWDVEVREDETKGGKSNRYNWNGEEWIDMNTGVYEEDIEFIINSFKIIQNDKYIYAVEDIEHKILFGIKWDGTHFIPKGIPRDVQRKLKEVSLFLDKLNISTIELLDFKNLFCSVFDIISGDSNNLYKMLDKRGKLLAKVSLDGTIIPTKLRLTRNNISQIKELISTAIDESVIGNTIVDNKNIYQLPFPERAVTINIIADRFPVSKTDKIKAIFQYADYMGNRFEDTCIIKGQGNSSAQSERISIAVDFDNIKVSFGSMPLQDSFHIKSYVWDKLRGVSVWAYDYATEVRNTLPFGERFPNDYLKIHTDAINGGNGKLENELPSGANFNSRGFPARVYLNGVFNGMYCPIYKKDRANYEQKKDNANHIHLDGEINATTFWNGSINWSMFEVRNPKGLIDIDGKKYDEGAELSNTDPFSKSVKDKIIRLSNAIPDIKANPTKEKFEEYFLPIPMIDYLIRSNVCYNYDGFSKNWQWLTWDGLRFGVSDHDWDTLFGMYYLGTFVLKNSTTAILGTSSSLPTGQLIKFYKPEIDARYKELRDNGILSVEYITNSLNKWIEKVGYDNYKEDFAMYSNTPPNRNSGLNAEYWELVGSSSSAVNYDATKAYTVGNTIVWGVSAKYAFKCVKNHTNQHPTTIMYPKYPQQLGYYESLWRINAWLKERFIATDNYFNYQ